MTDRYRTASGWTVEPVSLTLTPGRHDGQWLRVCYLGYFVADCGSITELERWISLTELKPQALMLAARPKPERNARGVWEGSPPRQAPCNAMTTPGALLCEMPEFLLQPTPGRGLHQPLLAR